MEDPLVLRGPAGPLLPTAAARSGTAARWAAQLWLSAGPVAWGRPICVVSRGPRMGQRAERPTGIFRAASGFPNLLADATGACQGQPGVAWERRSGACQRMPAVLAGRGTLWSPPVLPPCAAMASPLFPALAAGALLALLSQIPPSLNAAQRLLPVVWRPGDPEGIGSLSHRAPRHAAPRVLQRRSARGGARGALASGGATASAPARHRHRRQSAGPRRPWGLPASALSGAAQASGLPSPARSSPAAHR